MTFATIHSQVLSLNVRASLDTPKNPLHITSYHPKNPKITVTPSTPTITITNSPTLSVQDLLSRTKQDSKQVNFSLRHFVEQLVCILLFACFVLSDVVFVTVEVSETTFMGYDAWLPSPPKVDKPRSVYNAASLAFIDDCIYELYARRHFLFPPLNIEEYNDQVMAVVRCEAQDAMLQKLINDKVLSKEERDIIRWGKNISSAAKTRTKKRAGVAVYNRASSLEALVGHLYLTNTKRLDEIMLKLGFSADGPTKSILSDADGK